ncbi:c-type cytochrome [Rhodopirellula halodulae]|uniref:c-type cytochrome n=1 Tax=Rhodopirellula halodulae TaxID=2894198 RepID=UPI001E3B0DD1|nr:c-type cytochrome [Rhodopirellula sp. JC737]
MSQLRRKSRFKVFFTTRKSPAVIDETAPSYRVSTPRGFVVQMMTLRMMTTLLMTSLMCVATPSASAADAPSAKAPFVISIERFGRHQDIDSAIAARLLVTELSCTACHASGDSNLDPKRGPNLQSVGNRLQADWLREFLQAPHQTDPGTTMPNMVSQIAEDQRADVIDGLVAYLGQLRKPFPTLKAGGANPLQDEFWNKGDSNRGKELFHEVGCVACHAPDETVTPASNTVSTLDRLLDELTTDELEEMGLASAARSVPSIPLPNVAEKYTRQSLTHFLHSPSTVRPSGRMPDLHLTPDEAADITEYLFSNSQFNQQSTTIKKVDQPTQEQIELGQQWFQQLNCGQCHDTTATPAPVRIASWADLDAAAKHSCLSDANKKLGKPHFLLDALQRELLIRAIEDNSLQTSQVASEHAVQLALLQHNCVACHARGDLGGIGRNRKGYFESSALADLGDEGRLPPPLTGVGQKLKTDWIVKVLQGHASTRLRPHMTIRMPRYPQRDWKPFAKQLAVADDASELTAETVFANGQHPLEHLGAEGKRLMEIGCIQCHVFNGNSLPGVIGMDLHLATRRLRPLWMKEFLLEPASKKKGTRMPAFFPNGESQNHEILGGDTPLQIAAMWHYLNASDKHGVPDKIAEALAKDYELSPSERPIVHRTFMQDVGTHAIAVGFPEGIHFAVDAETPRLAMLWKGRFMDARSTWFDRFAPSVGPLGEQVVVFAKESSFELPAGESLDFKGLRLDRQGIPSFRYQFNGMQITDQLQPSGKKTMLRTITLSSPNETPPASLRWRLPTSKDLRPAASGDEDASTGMKIRILSEHESHQSGSQNPDGLTRLEIQPDQPLMLEYIW